VVSYAGVCRLDATNGVLRWLPVIWLLQCLCGPASSDRIERKGDSRLSEGPLRVDDSMAGDSWAEGLG
jgi:hypothetical protein